MRPGFRDMLIAMKDTKAASQAYRNYNESRILSARPVEIVHMLYEVAIDNLNIAIECFKSGDIFGRSRAVTKAQGAVHELMVALDPKVSPSLTRNLAELYDYVQRQIIAGHTRRSEEALHNALKVLKTLSEGWEGVRSKMMDSEAAPSVPEKQTHSAFETAISHLFAEPQGFGAPAAASGALGRGVSQCA